MNETTFFEPRFPRDISLLTDADLEAYYVHIFGGDEDE